MRLISKTLDLRLETSDFGLGTEDLRLENPGSKPFVVFISSLRSHVSGLLSCVLCLMFCATFASLLYAQEEAEEQDKVIDLPDVKIEILDTTQIDIPRERFRSFTRPAPELYTPLSPKERPWYLPPTSLPEKYRELPIEAEKGFLFSLTGYSGVPLIMSYQMLVVREFGNYEALLDMGRSTPRDDRTAKLVTDSSKGQGDSTVDRLKGSLAYQSDKSGLKADVRYYGRDFPLLDSNGERYDNDRSLADLSAGWVQKLSDNSQSSLNISVSNLRMDDPVSTETHGGLDLETDFGVSIPWPGSNPIDAGLSIGYFDSENEVGEFNEAILRLYLRDRYIRMWYFVLGVGAEFLIDVRKDSSVNGDWEPDIYPNPYLLLTSHIGIRTTLQIGIERRVLRQNLMDLYLDKDYVRFNPDLNLERSWDLNASLQYRLASKFIATIEPFDKEISDLIILEETNDEILSWAPNSLSSARIYGVNAKLELSLMDNRLKPSFEYTHESHDDQKIPYRPQDRGALTVKYLAPYGLEPSLSGEFYGTRYTKEGTDGDSLSGYFLWKPRISKTFGRYASVFLSAAIYTGEDDYQLWKGYQLPRQTVDFGLTLKF
jgi:hypothetical protein